MARSMSASHVAPPEGRLERPSGSTSPCHHLNLRTGPRTHRPDPWPVNTPTRPRARHRLSSAKTVKCRLAPPSCPPPSPRFLRFRHSEWKPPSNPGGMSDSRRSGCMAVPRRSNSSDTGSPSRHRMRTPSSRPRTRTSNCRESVRAGFHCTIDLLRTVSETNTRWRSQRDAPAHDQMSQSTTREVPPTRRD
ncbi:MAG: hypothetical protein ACJAZO_004659 [Myxococcota bacterium]|jgi:hypothetical protein